MAKEGTRLIFEDETTIEDASCGYSDGFLWCWVHGFSMPEAAQIFFDPEKTGTIVFEYGEMSDTYTGYTYCTSLFIDNDGKVSACLKRQEVA